MKKLSCMLLSLWLLFSMAAFASAEGAAAPTVNAKAAVLMDQATGDVLFAVDAHEKLYPASVTKIMSLLLFMEALENGTLTETAVVTASAAAAGKGGSQIWLKEGEQMTVDELLRATAIGSANDACCALAETIAGSEDAFVTLMNARAKELGMNDTNFVNCTGLDDDTEDHLTSAYDVALMSKALLSHEKIQQYSTVWMDSLRGGDTELVNTNKLVRFYDGVTGLKTGTTSKAGCCLSASAKRDGLHLIAVILGAENSKERFNAARALLDWGFASFENVTPEIDLSALLPIPVIRGVEDTVLPALDPVASMTLRKGEKEQLTQTLTLAEDVEAPVEEGQVLGTVTLQLADAQIASYALRAPHAIRRLTFSDVLLRSLRSLSARQCAN